MDILSYDDSNYSGGSKEGAREVPPPLFLDHTETSPPLSKGLDDPSPPAFISTLSYGTVVQGGLN